MRQGLNQGVNPTFSDVADTIQGILEAADPLQALIDKMGFSTKPDYMWGGHNENGAIELGGSGFDLTADMVTQEQASSVLGPGEFTVYDATGDSMYNSSDSELQPGAGSFAALFVGNFTDVSGTRYFFGDRDTTGWVLYRLGTTATFFCQSASGNQTATVAGLGADEISVILAVRDMTDLELDLWTPQGSDNTESVHNESCNSSAQKLAVGDTNAGSSTEMEFGIAAMWFGEAARALTGAHRTALATALGGS